MSIPVAALSYTFTFSLTQQGEHTLVFPSHLSMGQWSLSHSASTPVYVGVRSSYQTAHSILLRWSGVQDLSRVKRVTYSLTGPSVATSAGDVRQGMHGSDGEVTFEIGRHSNLHNATFKVEVGLELDDSELSKASASKPGGTSAESAAAALATRHSNDVRFVFSDGRELWANSSLLSAKSSYFKHILGSSFAEGQTQTIPSKQTPGASHPDDFNDSDEETDSAFAMSPPTASVDVYCPHPFHEINVNDTAYTTYKALLVWIATGHVSFASLKSSFWRKGWPLETAGFRRRVQMKEVRKDNSLAPLPSSPKSLYRLAQCLGLDELSALALGNLTSQLSADTVAYELFSDTTATCPAVADVVVKFASGQGKLGDENA